jgi:hypothetical protein
LTTFCFGLYSYYPVHEGRFMRRLEVERDAAPAGVGRTYPRELGRPWVAVRAHYGALPLMPAGRGTGKRRETAGTESPEEWPRGQKSPRWSVERRYRGLCVRRFRTTRCGRTTKARLSALRLPSWDEGRNQLPNPRVRRGNEEVCLQRIRCLTIESGIEVKRRRFQTHAVVPAEAGTHNP